MSSKLIEHYERHLGELDGAWSETAAGEQLPAKVLRFRDAPMKGLTTFGTLGLSEAELSLPNGRAVRQELLMSCHEPQQENVAGVLPAVASDLLADRRAVARGAVLGPAGPLFDETPLTALYCSVPVFFDDDFKVSNATEPPTVFVLLVPIADDEAQFVASNGWAPFERHLESTDPDLFDLSRGTSLRG
jgi:hypothetical protein